MKQFEWFKKERLSEQLKFFGAKKQRFISVYAKKPRIRVEYKQCVPDVVSFDSDGFTLGGGYGEPYNPQQNYGAALAEVNLNQAIDMARAQSSMLVQSAAMRCLQDYGVQENSARNYIGPSNV